MNFYTVFVIYNQLFSLQNNFLKNNISYSLCDNSTNETIKQENRIYCQNNSITYIDMNGNKGLPKAYNNAINLIPKTEDDWIIIFDQDTQVPEDFFKKFEENINLFPRSKIFVPVIKDSAGIMSPSKKNGLGFSHSELCDFNMNLQGYSFINSGMCINSTIFNQMKYDENFFLDMVDHDFVESVRKYFNNDVFHVMDDVELLQNFSGVTKNSMEADLVRFKILVKDQTYFYKKNYDDRRYSRKKLLLRACKLNLQHKTLKFFNILGGK